MARLIQQPAGSGPQSRLRAASFCNRVNNLKVARLGVPSLALIISITYNPSSLRPF